MLKRQVGSRLDPELSLYYDEESEIPETPPQTVSHSDTNADIDTSIEGKSNSPQQTHSTPHLKPNSPIDQIPESIQNESQNSPPFDMKSAFASKQTPEKSRTPPSTRRALEKKESMPSPKIPLPPLPPSPNNSSEPEVKHEPEIKHEPNQVVSSNDPYASLKAKNGGHLYPKLPNGKFDFSKSPAQQSNPDKVFNSDVTVCYRDVSTKVKISSGQKVQTFVSPVVDLFNAAATCGASCTSTDLYRIKDVSGIIRPGTATLVLSGPGEGKSTYLRALADRIEISSGRVVYNGRSPKQATQEGVDLRKLSFYTDQVETHLPLLTVYETLEFAAQLTCTNYNPQRVEDVITLLGLEECRDTIVGDSAGLVRGVSGGQRKRVTTGELLVSDASVLFLDEFSNGLDSSTALDIAKGLKKFCLKHNASIVATLQQPTPELFEMFDRIVVLREGHVVFDGPVNDVLPFFEAMGFRCPDDVDAADFLIDCLSQPRSVIYRQKEEDAHLRKKLAKHRGSGNPQLVKKATNVDTSYGPIKISNTPCVTTEEMLEYYHTTPQWKEIEEELNISLPQAQLDEKGRETYPVLDLDQYKSLTPTEESKQMFKLGYRLPFFALLSIVTLRQARVVMRNLQVLIPRVIMAVVLGAIYGSIYWNIATEDYILRLSAAMIAGTQILFGNFVEIPIAAQSDLVIKKQISQRLYGPWVVQIASYFTSIPINALEALIYTVILYWCNGNYPGPGQFFLYLIVLVCTSIHVSNFFRFLSALCKTEQNATAVASSLAGLMLLFSGLFITQSSIENSMEFMVFLLWWSPFSYVSKALLNIEFSSPRYDYIIQNELGDNVRAGNLYLTTVDMPVDMMWVLWCIIFLILGSFLYASAAALLLDVHFYEESIGTRRFHEVEIVDVDDDSNDGHTSLSDEELKHQVQAAAVQQAQIQHEASCDDSAFSRVVSSVGDVFDDAQSSQSNKLQTLREALPFTPAWMSFSDISYTVKVKKDKETVDRILLNNVNGYAQPGKMLALMGASGAGKTTLLDVIAGLKNTGVVEGKILINGQEATKNLIASMCGYVEQFDTLFPYSTVRETLLFAARLRLPRAISEEIKVKIVDEILDILDLTSAQDLIIGNDAIPGLSPAQSKRTNIGVELVANPSILFLDEPTTGLDSKNSMTVMKVVKRIARCGRAIICTIHQPSAELFFLFDRLLLLGAGGYQIYFGDLGRRAQHFVKYLTRLPGVAPIKARTNPASWMLVELGVGVAAEKGDDSARFKTAQAVDNQLVVEEEPEWANLSPSQRTVQLFRKMYLLSAEYQQAIKRIGILESIQLIDPNDAEGIERNRQEVEMTALKSKKRGTTFKPNGELASRTTLPTTTIIIPKNTGAVWYHQIMYLFVRNNMAYWRNQPFLYSRYGIQLLLSVVFGLLYYKIKITDVATSISFVGALMMGTAFTAVSFLTSNAGVFFETKPTFLREKASNYYTAWFHALCQLMIELMWILPSLVVSILPIYFMMGLEMSVDAFFLYCLFSYLYCVMFLTMSMFFCSIAPDSGSAGVFAASFLSFSNGLSGVAITESRLSKFWRFFYEVFPESHCLRALLSAQILPRTDEIQVLIDNQIQTLTVRDYLRYYLGWSFTSSFAWENAGWALLYIAILQIFTFFATHFLSFNKR